MFLLQPCGKRSPTSCGEMAKSRNLHIPLHQAGKDSRYHPPVSIQRVSSLRSAAVCEPAWCHQPENLTAKKVAPPGLQPFQSGTVHLLAAGHSDTLVRTASATCNRSKTLQMYRPEQHSPCSRPQKNGSQTPTEHPTPGAAFAPAFKQDVHTLPWLLS